MKKIFFASLILLSAFFTSCDKETALTEQATPIEIKNYVNTHFSGITILQTIKDKDGLSTSYEVILQHGTKLEFNGKKEIKEIESTAKLPDSVVPSKILQYVTANYTNNYIVGWELDNLHQQVKLNNGIELDFSMDGEFLRMDL